MTRPETTQQMIYALRQGLSVSFHPLHCVALRGRERAFAIALEHLAQPYDHIQRRS
jgi:hypothetical protein